MSGVSRIAAYLAAALLVLLAGLPLAQAHESRPAYLELKEAAAGQFSVVWRTPVLAGRIDHRDMYLTGEEQARHDRFTPCCSRALSGELVLDL